MDRRPRRETTPEQETVRRDGVVRAALTPAGAGLFAALCPLALGAALGLAQCRPTTPHDTPRPRVATPTAGQPTSVPPPATQPPLPVAPPVAPPAVPAVAPALFVIVMENHSYADLVGNPNAPYFNSLVSHYGLAANYSDDHRHPSLPNYIELTSGSRQRIHDDHGPDAHRLTVDNLGAQLERAHIPWRAYMESMGVPCRTSDTYRYTPRHDPFVYYLSLRSNPALCAQRVVDFRAFPSDLASGAYRFVWITPDLCDDSHDCTERRGDAFLERWVPVIQASPGYRAGGALFITWDEGSRGSERLATVVVSPRLVRPGFRSMVPHGHASLLATIEDTFGLPRLGDAIDAAPLSEFFGGDGG